MIERRQHPDTESSNRDPSPESRASGRIAQLPTHLVNQIAAGEVIERPASVVKELLENAIDAGAVDILIELEEGGKRLIRVTDDGAGIHADDLALALSSHATSKLKSEHDLHRVLTLGFRGEALASIASVSELDLESRRIGVEHGSSVRAREGAVAAGPPCSMATGTRVTVRNLFSQVPARKRFLKSDRAELQRVRGLVQPIALAVPGVGITLISDGRKVFRYPTAQAPIQRVAEVLGTDKSHRLLAVEGGDRLQGWIGRPDFFKRTSESAYVFLNGRVIKDKTVLHALRDGYSGFQIPGHYPVAVLFMDIAPDEVDVNVHPTKQEVRFRDTRMVHRLVRHAVKRTLELAGCVPDLFGSAPRTQAMPLAPRDAAIGEEATSSLAGSSNDSPDHAGIVSEDVFPGIARRALDADQRAWGRESVERSTGEEPFRQPGDDPRAFQVRNSFLVIEEVDGLRIIDQHALHEKILYEEILETREASSMRQPLLIPEPVPLSARELEVLAEAGAALAELGFVVEEFGEDTAIVRSIPTGFESRNVATLLRDALHRLGEALEHGASTAIDLRERVVATLACKRAVKAGDRLNREQIADLIVGRGRTFQPQNCPHGRPSELFLSWAELERRFDRK